MFLASKSNNSPCHASGLMVDVRSQIFSNVATMHSNKNSPV